MEITFKDILNIIKKNMLLIVIVSIILAMVTFIFTSCFVPEEYTSKVKLYVETNADSSQTNYNALNSMNYAKSVVPTYIEMLQTTKFYSEVSNTLDDKYTPSQLSQKITFMAIEDTEVFEAVVIDESPTEAKAIADAVAQTAPEILADFNDKANLKVVDDATLPKSPSSPNVAKNVLIAFAAGVVFSLIFAFGQEFFDTKIKYNDEMTEILGIPVLSAVPDFEKALNKTKHTRKEKH